MSETRQTGGLNDIQYFQLAARAASPTGLTPEVQKDAAGILYERIQDTSLGRFFGLMVLSV